MSLKAFHIVFIIASTFLAAGFGTWCVWHFRAGEGSGGELALGIASFLLVPVLLCYGQYFLRKLKHISYL